MKICPYCTHNILFQHSYEYESHFFMLKLSELANSATSLTPLCNWCFPMHAYRSRCGCFTRHSCGWKLQGNECFTACIQRHLLKQVAVSNNPCYLGMTRMVRVLLDRGENTAAAAPMHTKILHPALLGILLLSCAAKERTSNSLTRSFYIKHPCWASHH